MSSQVTSNIKRVRFATYVDVRVYDSEEPILSEEDSSDDEDVFFDALEEFEEEESVPPFSAVVETTLSAALKRPRGAENEEATPQQEYKRQRCSGLALVFGSPPLWGAPFEVYRDPVPSSSGTFFPRRSSAPPPPSSSRIGHDENGAAEVASSLPVFGPFPRPLGERKN